MGGGTLGPQVRCPCTNDENEGGAAFQLFRLNWITHHTFCWEYLLALRTELYYPVRIIRFHIFYGDYLLVLQNKIE